MFLTIQIVTWLQRNVDVSIDCRRRFVADDVDCVDRLTSQSLRIPNETGANGIGQAETSTFSFGTKIINLFIPCDFWIIKCKLIFLLKAKPKLKLKLKIRIKRRGIKL